MKNKNKAPTIEQSLKMIEEKLQSEKKNKKINKNIDEKKEDKSFLNLFKKDTGRKKTFIKTKKKDNVLLLTRKVDDQGKIIDLRNNKIVNKKKVFQPKKIVVEKEDKEVDLIIKDNKNLKKTIELAVIIKKLKSIRDKKIDTKKKSKKINKEIRKLNETIDLAENLFKKELLDL